MANCLTDSLAADFINDCDNLTVTGIESDVILIPLNDVDKTASIINVANRMLLDNLASASGKTGFLLEGVKQLNGYNWEFVPSEETTEVFPTPPFKLSIPIDFPILLYK